MIKKSTIVFMFLSAIVSCGYPSSTAKAMTVDDMSQLLSAYKQNSPSVLGASASAGSGSSMELSPKIELSPEKVKTLMQGLRYIDPKGSPMVIKVPLKAGVKDSTNVTALQIFLTAKGVFSADPTGTFGPATKKAVIAFQKEKKLVQDGIVGPKVRQAIADDISAATSATVSASATAGTRVQQ